MSILVVGAGPIGIEYTRILQSTGRSPLVVGRSAEGCKKLTEVTGVEALAGGIEAIAAARELPPDAIVAVSEDQLGNAAITLMKHGVRRLLVEKPGGVNAADIRAVHAAARHHGAEVYLAYNRRFYASTLEAQRIAAEDGGIQSCTFEFTEWTHRIEALNLSSVKTENWFWHNAVHVIDLAFHMAGWPVAMSAYSGGALKWHPRARFSGAGRTSNGALFSYSADWQAPGRWGVELMTARHRLVFRPLEQLHVQAIRTLDLKRIAIDDSLDQKFKPGYYRQVQSFLQSPAELLTLEEQIQHLDVYERILWGDG
jgi:predicted dehydrogenase